MDTTFQFPATSPTDPSDVALAIETAGALWRKGDSREALRWLKRAAETAETEGDDMRALSLARAAADLKDLLPATPSTPPSRSSAAPPPPSVRASARPAAPSASRSAIPPAPPLVASLTEELGVASTRLEAWAPPSARRAEPVTPSVPARPLGSAPSNSRPPPLPTSTPAPTRPVEVAPTPTAPIAQAVRAAPAAEAVRAAPPADAVRAAPALAGARAALRVSVEVLSRGSGTLVVRVLDEDEDPAPGAREALLVPFDAGVDLRNP